MSSSPNAKMNANTDRKCFVVMPFTVKDVDQGRYEDPNHWTEVYRGLIEPAFNGTGIQCARDDGDIGSRLIVEGILKKIEEADLVLCDLSSHNPNVFLELGWALRADRPFVLIKDDLTQFTFDLNQQYTFEYSHLLQPTVLSGQVRKLNEVIKRTVSDPEARYSVVKHMGVSAKAIQAASQGDYLPKMLLDILQKVESLGRPTRFPPARVSELDNRIMIASGTVALSSIKEQKLSSTEIVVRNGGILLVDADATIGKLTIGDATSPGTVSFSATHTLDVAGVVRFGPNADNTLDMSAHLTAPVLKARAIGFGSVRILAGSGTLFIAGPATFPPAQVSRPEQGRHIVVDSNTVELSSLNKTKLSSSDTILVRNEGVLCVDDDATIGDLRIGDATSPGTVSFLARHTLTVARDVYFGPNRGNTLDVRAPQTGSVLKVGGNALAAGIGNILAGSGTVFIG